MTDDARLPSTRKALLEAERLAEKKPSKRPRGAVEGPEEQIPDVRETLAKLRKVFAVRGN